MPDLREVFEMVKQQTEPDQDSWTEQERRMRQAERKRRIGALALVAALAVVISVVVVSNLEGPNESDAPASNGPSVVPVGSEFALVDVATGATTGTGIVPAGSEVDASTDGTKITYVATSDVGDAIHVANADGSNVQGFEQTASPGGGLSAPRWSPDGTKIVYQDRGIGGHIGNLYVLDVTSGQVKQITHLQSLSASVYYM